MSAHYQWITLPGRQDPGDSVFYDPVGWQIELLGHTRLGFVGHHEDLLVWKDKISGQVFYGEFDAADNDFLYDFGLAPEELTYCRFNEARNYPGLWLIHSEKVEQFCQYVMGWKPNVWDYDKKEREEICEAVKLHLG